MRDRLPILSTFPWSSSKTVGILASQASRLATSGARNRLLSILQLSDWLILQPYRDGTGFFLVFGTNTTALYSLFIGFWECLANLTVLLLTYLVTSADLAVFIINTINSSGDVGQKGRFYIII